MRKYRLNKEQFTEFVFGVIAMAGLAGLLVWFTYAWVMSI